MPRRSLDEYARKRDFARTPEPSAATAPERSGPLVFMVHRHQARRLHYDLRLELDGVLVSFAVPKGPSAKLGEKRLAVRTEDHPFPYGVFEGLIPAGEYGAGSSLIWDAGTYSPDEEGLCFGDREEAQRQVRDALEAGKLSLTFRGRKLKGSWALVRTKEAWLLLKHRDEAADPAEEVTEDARSVVSGLTNDELAAGRRPERRDPEPYYSPAMLPDSKPAALRPVPPMLAAAGLPIPGEGWSYEPKLDGIRLLASVDDGGPKLVSRGGIDITRTYPGIAAAIGRQPAASLLLDAEIVALDPAGRPSFELLQQRINLQDEAEIRRAEAAVPVICVVFDLVHLDGYDLARCPSWQRRELLSRVLLPTAVLQQIAAIELPPDEAFATAVELGFEGIIAKRDDSRYEAGRRSSAWRKRKATGTGVFLVAGWTAGEGSREPAFGGLLLGERGPAGLEYRGRVGSGFSDRDLAELRRRLDKLAATRSPFAAAVPGARKINWVKPELRVQVEYAERTAAGQLRSPVFRSLLAGNRAGSGAATAGAPSESQEALRDQIERFGRQGTLEGGSWTLPLTNLDKPLWPASAGHPAVTKRDLLLYALSAWPAAELHLRDRLLTLTRMPGGITGQRFYQRHWEGNLPPFVETVRVFSDSEGSDKNFLLCNNLPTLLWLCQLACLEWHIGLARVTPGPATTRFAGSLGALDSSVLSRPDLLLFDLDPYLYRGDERRGQEPLPGDAGFAAAKEAALAVREVLQSLTLPSFVKTSGSTGLHVVVPLQRTLEFAATRAAANTLAGELVTRHPRLLTTEWDTRRRRGKVFVDANQNARHKAIAAPYSPRSHPAAPVSMPVSWSRLPSLRLADYTMANVPALVAGQGDEWAGLAAAAIDLAARLGLT